MRGRRLRLYFAMLTSLAAEHCGQKIRRQCEENDPDAQNVLCPPPDHRTPPRRILVRGLFPDLCAHFRLSTLRQMIRGLIGTRM